MGGRREVEVEVEVVKRKREVEELEADDVIGSRTPAGWNCIFIFKQCMYSTPEGRLMHPRARDPIHSLTTPGIRWGSRVSILASQPTSVQTLR